MVKCMHGTWKSDSIKSIQLRYYKRRRRRNQLIKGNFTFMVRLTKGLTALTLPPAPFLVNLTKKRPLFF